MVFLTDKVFGFLVGGGGGRGAEAEFALGFEFFILGAGGADITSDISG